MEFLCLHGAYCNGTTFRTQLEPLLKVFGEGKDHKFTFVNGAFEMDPPVGSKEFFGTAPHHRFFPFHVTNILNSVRRCPKVLSPGRLLDYVKEEVGQEAFTDAVNGLMTMLAEHPSVTGLIGYSEGAMAAATMIMEEERRQRTDSRPRQIKGAIFFAGWPPVAETDYLGLGTEAEVEVEVVDVPTFHVIGSGDPFVEASMTLYRVCAEDTAELFDHGQGHMMPREMKTLKELSDALDQFVDGLE
ncbi:hypothetical protein PG995_014331 [Apiospora arundinis]